MVTAMVTGSPMSTVDGLIDKLLVLKDAGLGIRSSYSEKCATGAVTVCLIVLTIEGSIIHKLVAESQAAIVRLLSLAPVGS